MTGLRGASLGTLVFLLACYEGSDSSDEGQADGGQATDGAETDSDTDGDPSGDDGVDGECEGIPTAAPLRRLTNFEYDNTVADLLGDQSRPSSAFVSDDAAEGYNTHAAAAPLSQLQSERYLEAAEALAETAIQDLSSVLPCDPAQIDPLDCGGQFIDAFGPKAFRRPLADEERQDLTALFEDAQAEYGFDEAIGLVITAVLVSPSFLYRPELGESGAAEELVALQPYELASRLSYLIWASMPDDELFAAAADGRLEDAAEVETQARRMLQDARARRAVTEFHSQWLLLHTLRSVTKDPDTYPTWSDDIRGPLEDETRAFLEHVVFDAGGDLRELLTADYTFLNDEVGAFYGLDPQTAANFIRMDLEPERASGLLTHASILAAHGKPAQSDPVRRGTFVRERLLCQPLPDPPPDVDTTLPDVEEGVSNRERLLQHSTDPACAGCHNLIDPVGFGFEHYDGTGRWRDNDNGSPIDASGEIISTENSDGPFDGVDELGRRLAVSGEFDACFVRQWFRFAYARAETDGDECTLAALRDALTTADFDIQEFLVAFVGSQAFRTRVGFEPVGGE